jgi:hypothetical protein
MPTETCLPDICGEIKARPPSRGRRRSRAHSVQYPCGDRTRRRWFNHLIRKVFRIETDCAESGGSAFAIGCNAEPPLPLVATRALRPPQAIKTAKRELLFRGRHERQRAAALMERPPVHAVRSSCAS